VRDDLSLLPRFPVEAGDELPPPRPVWERFRWPGAAFFVFVAELQALRLAPADLGCDSYLLPFLAVSLAVYTIGLAALAKYAWHRANPFDE